MNRFVVTLSAVVVACHASVLYDPLLGVGLSEKALSQLPIITEPSVYSCNSLDLLHAQVGFNMMLNIPTSYTWRDAEKIGEAIDNLLKTTDNLADICNARQLYYETMRVTYPECVNVAYLLAQGSTTFQNVIQYVHLYKHLEFICGGGFDIYMYEFSCILNVGAKGLDTQCYNNFNSTIHGDPNNVCNAVPALTSCVQGVYTQNCNNWAGWAMCEYERHGFGSFCHGIRCNI